MPPVRKMSSSGGGRGKSAAASKRSGKAAAISKKPRSTSAKKTTNAPDDDPALDPIVRRDFITQFMQKAQAPTPIPGWSYFDVLGGTKGCDELGHSIHDMEDPRLKDPKLHGRCQAWMPLSLSDLKAACKTNGLLREGSKKVLALRLAIKAPKAKP
jgi:hypothetical protein